MEYEEFLSERRRRMADIIRVAFRQLVGESDAPPLTPPWFLLGAEAVWQDALSLLKVRQDAKQRLQAAVSQIAPVRNEIAHVREVERDRLLRASVACDDVLELLQVNSSRSGP